MGTSEAWIPVVYYLIAAIAGGFSAWLGARYGSKSTDKKLNVMSDRINGRMDHHDGLDENLKQQVTNIQQQNAVQTYKIEGVHDSINGRLEQWRNDIVRMVRAEVATALAEGKAAGVEQERTRKEEKK